MSEEVEEATGAGGLVRDLPYPRERAAGLRTFVQRRTLGRKVRFLRAFAASGTVLVGCAAAGVGRGAVSAWRASDEWFAGMFEAALEESTDILEAEARRRAVDGVEEPVVYQGLPTMVTDPLTGAERPFTVRRYSDGLLTTLLKAKRPEFRDGPRVTVGVNVQQSGVLLVPAPVTPEEWERAAAEQQDALARRRGGGG